MAGTIKVACPCGKSLLAKTEHAGKRAKCPGCGKVVTIPATVPVEMELTLADDEGLSLNAPTKSTQRAASSAKTAPRATTSAHQGQKALDPRPATQQKAPPKKSIWDEDEEYRLQVPEEAPCPQCGSMMSAQAVVCIACGFNRNTKTQTTTTVSTVGTPKGKAKSTSLERWLGKRSQWIVFLSILGSIGVLFLVGFVWSAAVLLVGLASLTVCLGLLLITLLWMQILLFRYNPKLAFALVFAVAISLFGYRLSFYGNWFGSEPNPAFRLPRKCLKISLYLFCYGAIVLLMVFGVHGERFKNDRRPVVNQQPAPLREPAAPFGHPIRPHR